jgi:hypothetical protein
MDCRRIEKRSMIIVPNKCFKILFSKVTLNVAVPAGHGIIHY